MRIFKIAVLLTVILIMNSCASGYKIINPNKLAYNSNDNSNGVTLSYKYDLLDKKYAKKEVKKGVKLVGIKITNNSDKDLVFGKDFQLTYDNGNTLSIIENDRVYTQLKQSAASYLLYLLLTPVNLFVTKPDGNGGVETTTTPIGYVLGPGIAGGNVIAASSANTKFKNDLLKNDLNEVVIKKGETVSGLIGVKTTTYDNIKIQLLP